MYPESNHFPPRPWRWPRPPPGWLPAAFLAPWPPPTLYLSTAADVIPLKTTVDLCSAPCNGSPFYAEWKLSSYNGLWGLTWSAPSTTSHTAPHWPPLTCLANLWIHVTHTWFHSLFSSHTGFLAVPWTSTPTPNSIPLNTWFPGPGMLFPRESAWLSPLLPASLSLNVIVVIKPILTTLFKIATYISSPLLSRYPWSWSTFCFTMILLTNLLYVSYLFYYLYPIECKLHENMNFCCFMGRSQAPSTWNYLIKICWVDKTYQNKRIKLRNQIIKYFL